jgi:choline transporter-like protein 2/4/5
VACFERVIRFITETAYVMMAISGKNFCTSAAEGFYLAIRSAGQVLITQSTLKVFVFIGVLFITLITTLIGWAVLTETSRFKYNIYSPLFPVLAFILVSFPIATTFMDFFSMAANSLLMCYCVEKDLSTSRNKCPAGLKAFM